MYLGEIIKKYRESNSLSMQAFADKCEVSKAYISMLERNQNSTSKKPIIPSIVTLKAVSAAMGITLDDLLKMLDGDQLIDTAIDIPNHPDIFIPKLKKVPMLGYTAAGEPMFCDECAEGFVDVLDRYDVDFCLKVKGNSMIGIGINDGDIVFVKRQPIVDNGEVAVVRINGDNVTLKRFYKEGDEIKLVSENPKCKTMIFTSKNCDDFIVLGKAVIKQSEII